MNYLNSVKRTYTILECVNVWTLNHSKNIKAWNNNNHIKTSEERAVKAEMRGKKMILCNCRKRTSKFY